MYVGKTLFAQVMEFVPWTSFSASSIATKAMPGFARCRAPSSFVPWRSRN